ncbi:MAG TPA: GNAT family N-acetyltransferase [Stellaceae bacterium]|nr:GNAT family N-acetyltransferase [Stellaceae bacterium]
MSVRVRVLRQDDLAAADRVYRLAFGTLLGLAEPATYRGDADLIRSRARAYPDGAFVAELGGEIVGVSLANNWGRLGVLGPVAVDPRHWHEGIAKRLLEPTVEVFERWQSRMVGLFTFPDPGHLRLYQGFGFWPRYLIAVMTKDVDDRAPTPESLSLSGNSAHRGALIDSCHALAAEVFPGLDLRREIETVAGPALGEILMLCDGAEVNGFAICHCGKGSEGGSQSCYLKFALVRPGSDAAQLFARLLAAANGFARERGARQLTAGVNAGRHRAHRHLVESGFRTLLQGVAMHRPWGEAYDRPEVFALDDWR